MFRNNQEIQQNWFQSSFERLPRGLRPVLTIALLASILTACISSGQIQVPVQDNATQASSLVETLSAPLTQSVKATETPGSTSTPQQNMSLLIGLLEPNAVVAEGLLNQLKPITGLTVVKGVTCQGMLINLDLKQDYLRTQNRNPVTVAFAINGSKPSNHDCVWTVSTTPEYSTTPILVYTDIFDAEMQADMARSGFTLLPYNDVVSGGLLEWLSLLP